jgi:hypothetical protein
MVTVLQCRKLWRFCWKNILNLMPRNVMSCICVTSYAGQEQIKLPDKFSYSNFCSSVYYNETILLCHFRDCSLIYFLADTTVRLLIICQNVFSFILIQTDWDWKERTSNCIHFINYVIFKASLPAEYRSSILVVSGGGDTRPEGATPEPTEWNTWLRLYKTFFI